MTPPHLCELRWMLDDRHLSPDSKLGIERSGASLRVTLRRPERANALDRDLVEDFLSLLEDRQLLENLHTLVIVGDGKNFCGGFDLSDAAAQDEASLVVRFLRIEMLLQRIYHAPFLTLACAHGHAVGAGADLFAACTYRIADSTARFRMPGWRFGIALGTRRLCDRIGAGVARDLLAASRTLSAREALECGLASHVVERANWDSTIEPLVAATSSLTPHALRDLLALSVPEHRDVDMAALVASALEPSGLKQRLLAYASGTPS